MIRYDAGTDLKSPVKTTAGGLKVQGRLTRSGIFTYKRADGSSVREYRPESEVFKSDSLDSYRGIPVTIGHPGLVTADNWHKHAVGHLGDDVTREDDAPFVVGTLHVQRADAVKALESKSLAELSCGYDVKIDPTPGEIDGERYDAVQRDIKLNHLAMGPKGWGRAGSDVAMRLDAQGDSLNYGYIMLDTVEDKQVPVSVTANEVNVRVDGQPEIDKLKAENAMLAGEVSSLKAAQAKAAADFDARLDSAVTERVSLVEQARKALGDKFDATGKTSRAIKAEVIVSKNAELKLDGKSEDFVNAAFEMALKFEVPAPVAATHPSLGQVRADASKALTAKPGISEAAERNRKAQAEMWKSPLSTERK